MPFAGPVNDDARATAASLAAGLGAEVVDASSRSVDLIVVGSQAGAPLAAFVRRGLLVLGEIKE